MGAVRGLDCDHEALFLGGGLGRGLIPDWQVFEVFISYVRILGVLGV